MAERPGSDLAAVLFDELAACRKRGIERLDVSTHNQQPLVAPKLQELAANYAAAARGPAHGRIPQLKYLLRDAVAAFGEEDETDAQLVSALFFGDSQHRVTKSAGELLDIAQRQFEYDQRRPVQAGQARRLRALRGIPVAFRWRGTSPAPDTVAERIRPSTPRRRTTPRC